MADEKEKCPDDRLEELYSWISTIPFSKPNRNLTRDFSDAVLMAEVLKVYYPRYVDLHNYVPASSLSTKKENWSILNRKVLSKIDMKLSKDAINQLANCHPGTAEQLLLELRDKILKNSEHQNSSYNDKEINSIDEGKAKADASHGQGTWDSRNEEDDAVPRHVCTQLRQELREKDDIICTLNRKVEYLESAMKVKDLRISNLASQILQNAVESEQLAKIQTNNDGQSKSRLRLINNRERVKVEE
ncbi:sperm flagellar protein 1-like [Hylaeus volcanicus]|uniref:sperm flagellar protein 1-like n=1 Tax=Hylaeus volcanicus TaxID=313075 RepID=UPI0023B8537C|nr:sperm flagellar protein 1-like [Hylaeus volcanicus]